MVTKIEKCKNKARCEMNRENCVHYAGTSKYPGGISEVEDKNADMRIPQLSLNHCEVADDLLKQIVFA